MSDEKNLKQSREMFDTMCRALEKNEWHYQKDEEKLCIECGAQGEDLPININIQIYTERLLLVLLSHMPFTVPEDKRVELAMAISVVNYKLADGSFDYNIANGNIVFRMTSSFLESLIGEEVINYILYSSCHIVDEYNDKFMMLAKGMISLEQFAESI